MYRTGEVESLLTSVMRAGAKTWKLSQMQLNAKKVQLFKMSEDAATEDERTVVKTRKEFELLRLLSTDKKALATGTCSWRSRSQLGERLSGCEREHAHWNQRPRKPQIR